MVSLQNVTITLGGNELQTPAKTVLSKVSLQFPTEKISVLLGASGCGKSTLLRLVAGLLAPDQGLVTRESEAISFVFQEPRLLPWLNVEENILLPFTLGGKSPKPDPSQVLQEVGLQTSRKLYPHQLSGGMKMRVSIARALIGQPRILLMDEPFAALDEVSRFQLQDFLLQIQQKWKMTVVFVTHSFSEAVYLADRIFLMQAKGGQLAKTQDVHFPERNFSLRSTTDYAREIHFWGLQLKESMEILS